MATGVEVIIVLKDSGLGAYVEYDDVADVMTAMQQKEPPVPIEAWKPFPWVDDVKLEVGVYTREEQVCVDRYCDEWETQMVDHIVALRLYNAKSTDWGYERRLALSFELGVLVNIIGHGKIALDGEAWWPIPGQKLV